MNSEPEVLKPAVTMIDPKRVVSITKQKTEEVLHAYVEGKHEDLEGVKAEAKCSTMTEWSKVVARLKDRDVKVDMNITAMGIFAMFPVVAEE